MTEPNERSRLPSPGLTLATLRRASPSLHHPVTRTLRLTEAELSSREITPLRVSIEDLSMRPRSNPRSRTPMRFESPLNHNEFRRESLGSENEAIQPPQRVTVRPLVGAATGINMDTRIRENRPVTPKSRKQGPSHRKVRRWNNDHFGSLASEIAESSRGVASVLHKAQSEAHLYKNIFDPKEHESYIFNKLMNDPTYESLRERYLEGELPRPQQRPSECMSTDRLIQLTPARMMDRIDPRLKSVVIKAGTNSQPAFMVMKRFEDYVKRAFAGQTMENQQFDDLLLAQPTRTKMTDSAYLCQFFFHPKSPAGGFHRLLLHAICQFHGLRVSSKTIDMQLGEHSEVRSLSVTGSIDAHLDTFHLVDCITDGARVAV